MTCAVKRFHFTGIRSNQCILLFGCRDDSSNRVYQTLRFINPWWRARNRQVSAGRASNRMMYRSIMCIAAIGLVHEAAAGEVDTAYQRYLRGLEAYAHPVSAPAPSDPPISKERVAPAPSDPPIFKAPISKEWIAPAPPARSWTGLYVGVHVGAAAGTGNFADPLSWSIFGDKVTTAGFLAAGRR